MIDFNVDFCAPGSPADVLNKIVVEALPDAPDDERRLAVRAVLESRREDVEAIIERTRTACAKRPVDAFGKFCHYTQVCRSISELAQMLHGGRRCTVSGCARQAESCCGFCLGCHAPGGMCQCP